MSEKDLLLAQFSKCTDYKDPLTIILFTRLKQMCSDKEIIDYMLLVGRWEKKEAQ
jgi:hypothetical protein